MSVDPKRYGKCWSCTHCEELGTYGYEESVFYMRKCNKSGHDYVDSCEHYCSDYVWDGKTQENTSSSSSSSYSSSSYTSSASSDSSGCGKGCLIGVIVVVILAVLGFLGTFMLVPKFDSPAKAPEGYEAVYEESLNITAVVNTKSDDLRMRSGPSTDYAVVHSLKKGDTVVIHHREGNWAYVEIEGIKGWCSNKYLKEK